jgi:hypothetical protein
MSDQAVIELQQPKVDDEMKAHEHGVIKFDCFSNASIYFHNLSKIWTIEGTLVSVCSINSHQTIYQPWGTLRFHRLEFDSVPFVDIDFNENVIRVKRGPNNVVKENDVNKRELPREYTCSIMRLQLFPGKIFKFNNNWAIGVNVKEFELTLNEDTLHTITCRFTDFFLHEKQYNLPVCNFDLPQLTVDDIEDANEPNIIYDELKPFRGADACLRLKHKLEWNSLQLFGSKIQELQNQLEEERKKREYEKEVAAAAADSAAAVDAALSGEHKEAESESDDDDEEEEEEEEEGLTPEQKFIHTLIGNVDAVFQNGVAALGDKSFDEQIHIINIMFNQMSNIYSKFQTTIADVKLKSDSDMIASRLETLTLEASVDERINETLKNVKLTRDIVAAAVEDSDRIMKKDKSIQHVNWNRLYSVCQESNMIWLLALHNEVKLFHSLDNKYALLTLPHYDEIYRLIMKYMQPTKNGFPYKLAKELYDRITLIRYDCSDEKLAQSEKDIKKFTSSILCQLDCSDQYNAFFRREFYHYNLLDILLYIYQLGNIVSSIVEEKSIDILLLCERRDDEGNKTYYSEDTKRNKMSLIKKEITLCIEVHRDFNWQRDIYYQDKQVRAFRFNSDKSIQEEVY